MSRMWLCLLSVRQCSQHCFIVQSTTFNRPHQNTEKLRIIRSAELTLVFNIGSQWSVSREIVQINHSA